MANMSDAYGDITIRIPKNLGMEALKHLVNVLAESMGRGCYNTDICDIESKDCYYEDGDEYAFTAGFSGTGRWSYSANIEYFGRWLIGDAKNHDGIDSTDVIFLQDTTFIVEWDYKDVEPGCCLCQTGTAKAVHKMNAPLQKISPDIDVQDLDFNEENVDDVMGDGYWAEMMGDEEAE